MYNAFKRQRKQRVFVKFVLIVLPVLIIIGVLVWFIFLKPDETTTSSFSKVGAEVAVVKPKVKDFNNSYFKITLPDSWVELGRQNPFSNQVYYEYQNKLKNYDNRWLRVYVDVYPEDFAITKVLPITVAQNKIHNEGASSISDECRSFTGSPISSQSGGAKTWTAKWKDVSFTCDMSKVSNYIGAASVEEGYGVTLIGSNGTKHRYFFLYIDFNVRPDYTVFTDALDTFRAN